MSEVGTLRELNVKPGDVVEYTQLGNGGHRVFVEYKDGWAYDTKGEPMCHDRPYWRIISRAAPIKYGPWKLATPDTRTTDDMQVSRGPNGEVVAYRVPVKPKVENVTLYGRNAPYWSNSKISGDTHKITFNTIDGEPDCTSIKMEEL